MVTIPRTHVRDRSLYVWMAVFIPVVVLIGFARTYYLKGFFGTPALPSLLVHFHGAVMTAWVVLFMTQVWLVSSRRTKVHQRLGIGGALLAALVVCVGTVTAVYSAARETPSDHPPLVFLAIPLGDMLVFAILIGIALYYRRWLETHKRLMLLATMSLLTAAIGRIPFDFILKGGPLVFFGLTDLCMLACVAFDSIRNRRVHPAFLWGTLFVIASQPLRVLLAGTSAWLRFAAMLVDLTK
ncbi:MAG TPA: hypothetical protein VJM12_21700 [Pyrinomonadaceae bacterium]|nr:hypothetical protein [Pyrinomonadaceae bacterium]